MQFSCQDDDCDYSVYHQAVRYHQHNFNFMLNLTDVMMARLKIKDVVLQRLSH